MEWVETTGATVADALDAALDQLGVHDDDVEYEVRRQRSSGVRRRTSGERSRDGFVGQRRAEWWRLAVGLVAEPFAATWWARSLRWWCRERGERLGESGRRGAAEGKQSGGDRRHPDRRAGGRRR